MSVELVDKYIDELQLIIEGLILKGEYKSVSNMLLPLNVFLNTYVDKQTFQKKPTRQSPIHDTEIPVKEIVFSVGDTNNNPVETSKASQKKLPKRKMVAIPTSNEENCELQSTLQNSGNGGGTEEDAITLTRPGSAVSKNKERKTTPFISGTQTSTYGSQTSGSKPRVNNESKSGV